MKKDLNDELQVEPPENAPRPPEHVVEKQNANARHAKKVRRLTLFLKRAGTMAFGALLIYAGVRLYLHTYSSVIDQSFRNFREWFVR